MAQDQEPQDLLTQDGALEERVEMLRLQSRRLRQRKLELQSWAFEVEAVRRERVWKREHDQEPSR